MTVNLNENCKTDMQLVEKASKTLKASKVQGTKCDRKKDLNSSLNNELCYFL
jgi:hypothetical protein